MQLEIARLKYISTNLKLGKSDLSENLQDKYNTK